jgi:hypothetical protein
MIKSLSALAIFAILGASVTALPAFAPEAKAAKAVALLKSDRLALQPVVQNCPNQIWPDFDESCLRTSDTGAIVQQARLVTARR